MSITYNSKSVSDTESFAEKLAEKYSPPHTFCLSGELGAGKTAFTRGLARGYGYEGRVISPTFTIMNIYEGKTGIYHYDLYRIADEDGLFDAGFEMPSGNAVAVLEWYDSFAYLFEGEDVTFVKITRAGDDERIIEVDDA